MLVVAPITQALPLLAEHIAILKHSENHRTLILLSIGAAPAESSLPPGLEPGFVQHQRNNRIYYLNNLATDAITSQLGVWYTASYPPPGVTTPHFFRPLHTPNFKGWLDQVAGQSRFRRLTEEDLALLVLSWELGD